jgi:hypothetical protein
MNTARSYEILSLLATMRVQALGHRAPLWPAPKRQSLKCFGGNMSIEEFRSYGGLKEPPQLFWPFERLVVMTRSEGEASLHVPGPKGVSLNSSQKIAAIENASAKTDTLKLKRNKPLARSTSKLESALGIKRKGASE